MITVESPTQTPGEYAREERTELDLADRFLMSYWSARLRCTPTELLAVVGHVGRSVPLVRAEVARRAVVRNSFAAQR
jgi:hypothetical protein